MSNNEHPEATGGVLVLFTPPVASAIIFQQLFQVYIAGGGAKRGGHTREKREVKNETGWQLAS